MQLDSDMMVMRNMDELMDIELDAPDSEGKGNRVFAASHACVCNPKKKPHYPKDWWAPKMIPSGLNKSYQLKGRVGSQRTARIPHSTTILMSHRRKVPPPPLA